METSRTKCDGRWAATGNQTASCAFFPRITIHGNFPVTALGWGWGPPLKPCVYEKTREGGAFLGLGVLPPDRSPPGAGAAAGHAQACLQRLRARGPPTPSASPASPAPSLFHGSLFPLCLGGRLLDEKTVLDDMLACVDHGRPDVLHPVPGIDSWRRGGFSKERNLKSG